MGADFTKGIVRILGPDDETVGTGFVVHADGYIATCAHVIDAADAARGQNISIVWHATKEKTQARISDYWRDSNEQDIAILSLLEGEKLPLEVIPLPLGSSFNIEGQTLVSFGFPQAKSIDGLRGEIRILGSGTEGNIPVIQGSSLQISKGFSGAPVWHPDREVVVGMVRSIIGYMSVKLNRAAAIRVPIDPDARQSETAFFTPTELLLDVCPLLVPSVEPPYRGLSFFKEDEKDAKFFYGREAFIKEMLDKLALQNTRFITVLGPSGSGKSSTIRAGLVYQLRHGAIPDSNQWHILTIRPMADPFKALADQGLDLQGQATVVKSIRMWYEQDPELKRLLLVIDQFEELLYMCSDTVCQDFTSALRQLLGSAFPITIIAILRNDFYNQFEKREILLDWLEQSQIRIPRKLTREEVTAIVQKPALKVGLRFEKNLVEAIVDDAVEMNNSDASGVSSTILPLLEFALNELWNCRKDGELTWKDYEQIGGVRGGLRSWANKAYTGLRDEEKQYKARRIFTDLIYIGDAGRGLPDGRLRVPLLALSHNEYETEEVNQIVYSLVDQRLLVANLDEQSKQEMIEIIHDALIIQWDQLRSWIQEDRDFLAWRQAFEDDVRAWILSQRAPYKLVQEKDLEQALIWLNGRRADLTVEQRNFIRASQVQQDEISKAALSQEQEKDSNVKRRLLTRRAFFGGVIGGIMALALSFGSIGWWERMQNRHLFSPHGVLLYTYAGHENAGPVLNVAWSPNSLLIASSDSNRQIDICNARDGTHVLRCQPSPGGAVSSVAWSPDSNYLASGSDDKLLYLWDTMGSLLKTFHGHRDDVHCVAWSPDGRYIATGCNDCRAYIWDITHAHPLHIFSHPDRVWQVVWSPDGKYIASTCSDDKVRIWDASTGEQTRIYIEHTDEVVTVTWSPDGKYIASGGRDSQVCVWDAYSLDTMYIYSGHSSLVDSIAWSPDGTRIASAGGHDNNSPSSPEDHTVQVWNAFNGNYPLYYEGHMDRVHSIAWSPDGTRIVSGGYDRSVQVWKPI